MLEEKLELLDKHLKSLKTKSVDFSLTTEHKNCTFCTYKTICNR